MVKRRRRLMLRVVSLLAVTAVVAAACTSSGGGDDAGASTDAGEPRCQLPLPGGPDPWPSYEINPDPSAAPNGVDRQPLAARPSPAPRPDDCAPVDPTKGIGNINHLVFIVMENRSFDHYFGTFPGADGLPMKDGKPAVCQPTSNGGCAYPYHDTNFIDQGGPHGHKSSLMSYDDGKMDGFIRALDAYSNGCRQHPTEPPCPQATNGPDGQPDIMGFHDADEIPNYWAYAQRYTLFDRMFAPVDSWTLPSHLYLVSGWSAWCPNLDDPMSCRSELVFHPPSQFGDQWDGLTWVAREADQYPRPYVWAPITWLLYQAGVSWGYFVGAGSCVLPPCDDLEGPTSADVVDPLPGFAATEATGQFANIRPNDDFLGMAAHGNLPAVSWVVPELHAGDHPPDDISLGQRYVTDLINAVAKGPQEQWNHTAIFVTWDDWGGFYDHVKPPQNIAGVPGDNYGFRVPAFLVSPYAAQGIDHSTMSFDAFLRLIEDRFLDRDRLDGENRGWPDSRPSTRETAPELHPLDGAFDFTQEPIPPLVLDPMPSR
jgi:phospholipase C